eukprot:5514941-Prymnesium_polylepis.1
MECTVTSTVRPPFHGSLSTAPRPTFAVLLPAPPLPHPGGASPPPESRGHSPRDERVFNTPGACHRCVA